MEVKNKMDDMKKMSYKKFLLMLLVSFIFMYGIMFLNIVELDHFYISINRIYMALLMASAMGVIMMAMMYKMYPDKKKKQYNNDNQFGSFWIYTGRNKNPNTN